MSSLVPSTVLSGNCSIDDLPDQLDLSELADDMERLWEKSMARLNEGIIFEHAATIVVQADGSLKLINEVAGSPNFVKPNLAVTASQIFIGTFHTHPRVDGLLPMPFSYVDFVTAIQWREKLSILYSDQIAFALIRTLSTVDTVDPITVKNEFDAFAESIDAKDRDLLMDAI